MDFRDWFVVVFIVVVAIFGMWFVAKHPDPINFGTLNLLIGGLISFYHVIVIKDSKQADAP